MSRDEIISKFPRATEDFIRLNATDVDHRDQGHRESSIIQNGQAGVRLAGQKDQEDNGPTDNPARAPYLDAKSTAAYRVEITLRFSDRRRIDSDGCVSTIFDVLTTVRRLLVRDPRALRKLRTVRTWKRRGDDQDNPDTVNEAVPF